MGNCLAGKPLPRVENILDAGESSPQPAVIIVLPPRLRATLDRQIIVAESTIRRMINILADHGGPKSTQSQRQQQLWTELTDGLRDAIVVISRVYVDFLLERLKPQKTPHSLSLPPTPPLSHDFLDDLDLADRFFVVGLLALGPGSPELDPDQAPGEQSARHRPEMIEVKRPR